MFTWVKLLWCCMIVKVNIFSDSCIVTELIDCNDGGVSMAMCNEACYEIYLVMWQVNGVLGVTVDCG